MGWFLTLIFVALLIWLFWILSRFYDRAKVEWAMPKRERIEIFKSAQIDYANEVLNGQDSLPVSEVVEAATKCSSQYSLIKYHPKEWASAISDGYIESLCIEADLYFTAEQFWDEFLEEPVTTLEGLFELDRALYLEYLRLWSEGRVPVGRQLPTQKNIEEHEEEKQAIKKARVQKITDRIVANQKSEKP